MLSIQALWEKLWNNRGPRSWRWAKFLPFAIFRAYMKENIAKDAQSLVYVTLLTLVPLLAVAFALLQGFGLRGVIEPWLEDLFAPMGAAGAEVVSYLMEFVSNTSAGNLGIIGVIFLFFSVLNISQSIEQALHDIWRVENARSLRARLMGYFTTLLLAPLLISAIMTMMLGMKDASWLQPFLHIPGMSGLFKLLTGFLPITMVFVLIAGVYSWIPNCKVSWKAAFTGSAFFLLLWYPVSKIFSIFIAGSTNYSVIYSSFASVIILLFWLQFLWLIFLMGAKVASLVQIPSLLSPYNENQWYADEQMKLGLMLYAITQNRYKHNQSAPDMAFFNRCTGSTPYKIRLILDRLIQAKLISEVSGEPPRYMPSKPAEQYRLSELYHALAAPKGTFPEFSGAYQQLEQDFLSRLEQSMPNDDDENPIKRDEAEEYRSRRQAREAARAQKAAEREAYFAAKRAAKAEKKVQGKKPWWRWEK